MKAIRKQTRGFTLIELMIVVAIIGILAAIAIPNFVRFQAKTKQSEAKTNLKALFTAQKALFGEKDFYSNDGTLIGWSPENGNRYAYDLGLTTGGPNAAAAVPWVRDATNTKPAAGWNTITIDQSRFGVTVPTPTAFAATFTGVPTGATPGTTGVTGVCPACAFTASAAGNVDSDVIFDSWFVTSENGTDTLAACIPESAVGAGIPFNNNNDVACD